MQGLCDSIAASSILRKARLQRGSDVRADLTAYVAKATMRARRFISRYGWREQRQLSHGFAPVRLKATYEQLLLRNSLAGECRVQEGSPGDIFAISAGFLNGPADGTARGIGVLHADDAHWVLIARAGNDGLLIFDSSGDDRSYTLTRLQNGRRARDGRSLSTETLLMLSVQPGG